MNIGIIGSRGIPNRYGGFEQFAAYLSEGLVKRGQQVWVYNSSRHPYREKSWKGVNIIHCKDPENMLGTAGQFIYDLNCILDSRKRKFDVILQLGYTSSSVWHRLLPRNAEIITNMDGLEWMRDKYSKPVKKFLRYAESLAVKYSDVLVADSKGIQEYLMKEYDRSSVFIPYGAGLFLSPVIDPVKMLNLQPHNYHLLIARLEPENSVEMILQASSDAARKIKIVVVGNNRTDYGKYLKKKFSQPHIRFLGPVYDEELLNNLRHYCRLYFHGHTAGGTNPSLLEAMAAGALIAAHDNVFNRMVLGEDGYYFSNKNDLQQLIEMESRENSDHRMEKNNLEKIRDIYSWEKIVNAYEQLFVESMQK